MSVFRISCCSSVVAGISAFPSLEPFGLEDAVEGSLGENPDLKEHLREEHLGQEHWGC